MILARDLNGAIGKDNCIPWNCKNDMSFFINTTRKNVVVMARKTFESVGCLPARQTVVITSDRSFTHDKAIVVYSIEELHKYLDRADSRTAFICGGQTLYEQLIDHVDDVYLSTLYTSVDRPDTWFLKFTGNWKAESTLAYPDCSIALLKRL